jgi:hypothetical protein
MVAPLTRRIEPLGWHVEVNVWARDLPTVIPLLEDLTTRVVLDHVAHIPEPEGAADALFGQVLRLVDKGKTWVKLAAPYAATKVGPPTYADASARTRAYVKAAPGRLIICGTNRPHSAKTRSPTMRSCSTCCSTGRPTWGGVVRSRRSPDYMRSDDGRVVLQHPPREIAEGRADDAGAQPVVVRFLRFARADRLDCAGSARHQLQPRAAFEE